MVWTLHGNGDVPPDAGNLPPAAATGGMPNRKRGRRATPRAKAQPGPKRWRPADIATRLAEVETSARALIPQVAGVYLLLDNRNGCFRVCYPGKAIKSYAWTLRGLPAAFQLVYDWVWARHLAATGASPPHTRAELAGFFV